MGGGRYATDYTDSAEGIFHGVIVVFLGEQTLSLLCHLCVKKTKYYFVRNVYLLLLSMYVLIVHCTQLCKNTVV